jgi:ribosomal protein S18 acetylase RimI-like enzyme
VNVGIRPIQLADGDDLRRIERSAGTRFRDVGMEQIASAEPLSVEEFSRYERVGHGWVAVGNAGSLIGFVVISEIDGGAHIDQVSVEQAYQGTGVGRALINRVRHFAIDRQLSGVTLTTFSMVPWNAPLYRHLGFRDLTFDELGPELALLREREAARGLNPVDRTCMWLELQ